MNDIRLPARAVSAGNNSDTASGIVAVVVPGSLYHVVDRGVGRVYALVGTGSRIRSRPGMIGRLLSSSQRGPWLEYITSRSETSRSSRSSPTPRGARTATWCVSDHRVHSSSSTRASIPELREAIHAAGTRPAHVLVTHGHPDHLGAAAVLSNWLDIECRVGREDARIARHASAYAAAFGGLRIEAPSRIGYLSGDEVLRFGERTVSVVALPGHTPGSLGFDIGEVVLTGDTLFRENLGRSDFPGSDPVALTASIDRLLADRGADVPLMAGHGRPWTTGEAREWWAAQGHPSATSVPT